MGHYFKIWLQRGLTNQNCRESFIFNILEIYLFIDNVKNMLVTFLGYFLIV